jgi:hypothetical protein
MEWRKILGVYEAGLGQKLNLRKTSIFFSRNTTLERKEEEAKAICQIPLSPGLPKDRLIWMGTKKADFTLEVLII